MCNDNYQLKVVSSLWHLGSQGGLGITLKVTSGMVMIPLSAIRFSRRKMPPRRLRRGLDMNGSLHQTISYLPSLIIRSKDWCLSLELEIVTFEGIDTNLGRVWYV
jgi:hypothetical protein